MGRRHSHYSASHILFPIFMFGVCFKDRNNKNKCKLATSEVNASLIRVQ